jgi:hypothetical protein
MVRIAAKIGVAIAKGNCNELFDVMNSAVEMEEISVTNAPRTMIRLLESL